jgi:hypothetical protein
MVWPDQFGQAAKGLMTRMNREKVKGYFREFKQGT